MEITARRTLNNGVTIPRLGLGVFLVAEGEETVNAVRWALELGYRHIDTAAGYRNEASVGKAIRESSIDRGEIFVTTKLNNPDRGYDSTFAAFDKSRKELGLDVIDCYLIHWPGKNAGCDSWRAMEKIYAKGKARSIGVSNFLEHHLEDLAARSEVVPAMNQVEFHPFLMQKSLMAYDAEHGIAHEAWSPLSRGRKMNDPTITSVAREAGKTNAQVMLRWALQHDVIVIPKSVHRERIKENGELFDFELSDAQMASLDALDCDGRIGPHPDSFGL